MTMMLPNQVPVSFEYKISFRGAQSTLRLSTQFILIQEMISAAFENRTEEIQAVHGYKAQFIHFTTVGTYSYHWTLNFSRCSRHPLWVLYWIMETDATCEVPLCETNYYFRQVPLSPSLVPRSHT